MIQKGFISLYEGLKYGQAFVKVHEYLIPPEGEEEKKDA